MPRPRREQPTLFPLENRLYCGDNLEVLRLYQPDESVDLIYLDPPFKKQASYNVLFKELSGRKAAAQIKAFADTWTWDAGSIAAYQGIVEGTDERLSQAMQAFYTFLGSSEMMAYLAMMAPRLVELRRVLKPTGSIYLHCDPAASHYLKMLMDAVFGPRHFQNEIVWRYRRWTGGARRFLRMHDTLFFYARSKAYKFNRLFTPYTEKSLARKQNYHTRIKGDDVYVTSVNPEGVAENDVWEIQLLNSQAKERLGYPTQKPVALLERIILASSDPGDVVLDPFCGCGTTIDAAQRLDRKWIGIDITHKATDVIEARLLATYGDEILKTYSVHWDPVSPEDAAALAERKPLAFEDWAVRRLGGTGSGKRGADRGIDGRIRFHDEPDGPTRQIVISVKAGHIGPAHVRDLRGVLGREKADIGVLVSMREPTISMRREASGAGDYLSVVWDEKYPRIQLLTAEGLLNGKTVRYPRGDKLAGRMALDRAATPAQPELAEPQMLEREPAEPIERQPSRERKREAVE